MNQSVFHVRRATVDDLGALRALWETMHFSANDLERRLTEFQVAVAEDGSLRGALGMQMSGRHGMLHSEAFSDFALADTLRQQLWARMQSVISNHGLARLWTRETAPFWRQNGFLPADAEALKKFPTTWATEPTDWLTVQLRDEAALEISLEKEFARFKEEEKRSMAKALNRGRTLKFVATILAIILAGGVLVAFVYTLRNYSHFPGR
jgi:N-acetylglutamate synthase-like GNAT family acetyltransferase